MKKKLGIIGGLGTDTAAQFYIDTERMWFSAGEKQHVPLTIENIQSPFSLEQSLTKTMDRVDELESFLCKAAITLEKGHSSIIVLPCNTAHVHIEAIRKVITVPMLSITEEAAKALQKNNVSTAAILGTKVTKESKIYEKECQTRGIETIYPDEDDQLIIEKIIGRTLSWKNDQSDTKKLLAIIDHMIQKGADGVVLACTDLQLCMPKQSLDYVFDSMNILAQASVKELLNHSK